MAFGGKVSFPLNTKWGYLFAGGAATAPQGTGQTLTNWNWITQLTMGSRRYLPIDDFFWEKKTAVMIFLVMPGVGSGNDRGESAVGAEPGTRWMNLS